MKNIYSGISNFVLQYFQFYHPNGLALITLKMNSMIDGATVLKKYSGSLVAANFAEPYDSSFCVIHTFEIICTSLVIMLTCIVLFAVDTLRIY